ncbi:AAA family ATPase [Candidatus Woesearchaeota archaeon]|nr:AAA family ATPase [Candidatus Woesearchaeota archaeon]
MGLFSDILKSDETLFKNPVALEFSFQPKLIKYREEKQHYIASCIKPLLQERDGRNLIITGKPGVGKTVCLKHVLGELEEEYSEEIFCIYVNCWKKDSPFKMVSEICEQVGYKWVHNKRIDELIKAAATIINKKSAVFVFDEIDKLQDHLVIYNLLEEIYKKSLILITNDDGFLSKLDQRVKSRLMPNTLKFEPYSLIQTSGILKQRVEWAFYEEVFNEEILELISKKTFENEDIRLGLFLLKESAEMAEGFAKRKVELDHVNQSLEKINEFKTKDLNYLDKKKQYLLELVKKNNGKTINEIFKIYQDEGGSQTYRTFHRKVKDLESKKLLQLKEEFRGSFGRVTIVEYDTNKKINEF